MDAADPPPGADPIQLDPRNPDEPTVLLSQPTGWQLLADQGAPPLIRGILYNQELRLHGFTPNAVVTVEELTGRVGVPAQALAKERAEVIGIVGELDTESPGTVSGFPSTTITYNLQGRPATGLIVAAQNAQDRIWAVTVTLQSTDPANPHYISARQEILDSFRVRLPDPYRRRDRR